MFELKCPPSQQQQKSILYVPYVKAKRNIAVGEEIFVQYGDSEWFEGHGLTYVSVDPALAMWRPELTPLPCRQPVDQIAADDDDDVSYIITKDVPAGTVLETSLCLEMPPDTVDTYSLGDVVLTWGINPPMLTGRTENMHAGSQ